MAIVLLIGFTLIATAVFVIPQTPVGLICILIGFTMVFVAIGYSYIQR